MVRLQQSRPRAEADSAGLVNLNRSAGMKILIVVLMVLTMGSLSSSQQSQLPADVIFVNGDIHTGSGDVSVTTKNGTLRPLTPKIPPRSVQALAVSAGNLIAVGSNGEIKKLVGPKTQVVDLG